MNKAKGDNNIADMGTKRMTKKQLATFKVALGITSNTPMTPAEKAEISAGAMELAIQQHLENGHATPLDPKYGPCDAYQHGLEQLD